MTSKISDKNRTKLHKIPGVTGVFTGKKSTGGVKTDTTAIVVSVAEKRPLDQIPKKERIPAEIDGVPTDVIQEIIRPCVTDAAHYDPLIGGASISDRDGHYWGTLGFIAQDTLSGDPVLISCHHVLMQFGNDVGSYVLQPSWFLGGINDLDTCGFVLRGQLSGSVDAACAKILNRAMVNKILDIGEVTGTAPATVSMSVHKRGATTGLTTGTVDAIDSSVVVAYPKPIGEITFTNTVRFVGSAGMVLGGDSGSALASGTTVVGIVFASDEGGGAAYASPIAEVFSALGLTFYAPLTGTALKGDDIEMYSTTLSVNQKDGQYLDDWELYGVVSFDSDDCRLKIGMGNHSVPAETYAYSLEFKGRDHSSSPFTLTTPSGSIVADGEPFDHRAQISFRLSWKNSTHTLSAQAQQGDGPLAQATLVEPAVPALTPSYHVMVRGRQTENLTVAEIFTLTLSRDCGSGSPIPAGRDWTAESNTNGTWDVSADAHYLSAGAGGVAGVPSGVADITGLVTGNLIDFTATGYFDLGDENYEITVGFVGDNGGYDLEFEFEGNTHRSVSPHRALTLNGFGSDDGEYTNDGIPSFIAGAPVTWTITIQPSTDTVELTLSQSSSNWTLTHTDTDWYTNAGDTGTDVFAEVVGKTSADNAESIISVQDVTLL